MTEFKHPKSILAEMLATRGQTLPVYNTVKVGSTFVCTVTFNGNSFKSSPKLKKKEAEKEAALGVLFQDKIRGPTANREALPDGAENDNEEQANEKVEEQFNQQDLEALLGSLSLGNNVDCTLTLKSENKMFGGEFTFYNEHLKRMDTVSVDAKLYTKGSVAINLRNETLNKLSNDQKAEAVTTPVQRNFKDAEIPATLHQPRKYQKYFYKKAMEDNIICCIPTGLGKTQIAAMVISKMKEMNPKKRILFLVERIPLVLQLENYIHDQTGLNVIGVHGDMSIDAKLNDHHDVLVSISSFFLNLLKFNKVVMGQYSLIVFDEAHHMVKDNSFSMLLKNHYKAMKEDVKPKVMGLTASPGGKSSWIDTFISLKVMSCISGCSIISPDAETQADIEEHRITAELQLKELPQHPKEIFLMKAINCITRNFASSLVPTRKEYLYEDIQELLVKLENTNNENEKLLLSIANKCYDLVTYGKDPKDASHPTEDCKQILINRLEATNIPKEKKQRLLEGLIEFDDDDTTNICKLDIALNILEEKNQTDPAFKAILFPGKVSGHGSTKSGGQSTKSQKDNVEKFRSGQYNVIVATAVLEEGLDVPKCNVVIRIDSPATVTAFTQCRGHLRSKKSEFYAILKDFESNIYPNLIKQEFYIKEAIEYLSDEDAGLPESYIQILNNSVNPKFDFEELLSKCRVYFQLDTKFVTKHVGGPQHQPEFICGLYLNNELKETCKGRSKKDAKDKVSRQALVNGLIPMIIRDKHMKLKKVRWGEDDASGLDQFDPNSNKSGSTISGGEPKKNKNLLITSSINGSGDDISMDDVPPTQHQQAQPERREYEIDFNELEFGEPLGKGFFGEVKRGTWRETDVAIKIIYRCQFKTKTSVEMFQNEVSILSKLRHPNVVQFLGACTSGSEEHHCIVIEWMGGGSLRQFLIDYFQFLEQNPLLRLNIAKDIAKGMCYLHGSNPPILHRDLSSGNILLDNTIDTRRTYNVNDFKCKISDFGLSRLKMEQGTMTASVGCIPYMAPEVFKGESNSEKSDVYSYAMILWELLTSEEPQQDMKPMKMANLAAHESYRPPIPLTTNPKWKELITMCWDSNPDRRPTFKQIIDHIKEMESKGISSFAPIPVANFDTGLYG
ncbi:hypothetical protein PPL_11046 [Heterostelium album PN500]|uniref:Uncharacterized protein n=1 Tax=Heterostelium pallidum (strain ATCC 26659 / Pp 5 / PN500) TaxID=670386 RepID=D3BSS6_HETP5|nr:hypothetical protein PPL_11046 [Heterostelium album PN500]EFA75541.1 hypothetical protein PPL_11046 [Heterostelium album PN500]|eukprot:XP_020427675.1 hypothetical protein PPL_11046 [Heterostelium album PN500]